jgi:hypothetical protein
MHSHPNGRRDCAVYLDSVPTVHCVHTSCIGAIDKANHDLRSAIAKGSMNGKPWQPAPEDLQRERERQARERLKHRAAIAASTILERFAAEPADLFERSLVRLLDNPAGDWRLLLGLVPPGAMIWIGDTKDTGQPRHGVHFRTVAEWLEESEAPGNFTCPSLFKLGSYSRSNDNAVARPFLVIESDSLTKAEICAVFHWLSQPLRLRAIVDTGGKSLHGWFDFPDPDRLEELRVVLPALGCDPALFKPSQPVRLPGARRGDNWQTLLYLDGEVA